MKFLRNPECFEFFPLNACPTHLMTILVREKAAQMNSLFRFHCKSYVNHPVIQRRMTKTKSNKQVAVFALLASFLHADFESNGVLAHGKEKVPYRRSRGTTRNHGTANNRNLGKGSYSSGTNYFYQNGYYGRSSGNSGSGSSNSRNSGSSSGSSSSGYNNNYNGVQGSSSLMQRSGGPGVFTVALVALGLIGAALLYFAWPKIVGGKSAKTNEPSSDYGKYEEGNKKVAIRVNKGQSFSTARFGKKPKKPLQIV